MATTYPESRLRTTQVMIVDDHPTVREGLRHCIESQHDMTVCGEASDVGEALKKIPALNPEVVIVDIALKNSDGLELIKALRTRHKQIRALVHSMYDETIYADRCLNAGALGYLNKEADSTEVIQAIRKVRTGEVYLSPAMSGTILGRSVGNRAAITDPVDGLTDRQLEVLRMIGDGKSANQIAEALHLSVHTIETHRENIKRKLALRTMPELTRFAVLWCSRQGAAATTE